MSMKKGACTKLHGARTASDTLDGRFANFAHGKEWDAMEEYDQVTRLGQGACGAVYLVRHKGSKRLFALKTIILDESRKNRRKETVIKEAKILSELKHPNIVAFHESFFDLKEDKLCIIQDYCDGGTLDDRISETARKKEYFPEKQIMKWMIQICMAVQYMHLKRILHRDLKTQNVFMTKKGNTCKLGDFGISKMMDATVDVASTCVGTPCYLSPEMCQDIPYTSKADVWALGCLVYEMIALQPAFDANNLISLFYKIVKGEYEPIPAHYSPALEEVVRAILIKSPDDRPSARQILALPYVSDMLSEFIEEKEYQIQLRALREAKETPKSERRSCMIEQSPETRLSTRSSPAVADPVLSTIDSPVDRGRSDSGISVGNQAPTPESESSAKLKCKLCGKKFHLRSWLQKHLSMKHSGKQEDACDGEDEEEGAVAKEEEEEDASNPVDYQDDFEADSDSEIEDDIPEELPEGQAAEDNSDEEEEYDDDFEEYDSDEDLDGVVTYARELQVGESEMPDETIVDDAPSHLMNQCKNFIQEHCMRAIGRKKSDLGRITEEDLKPQFQRFAGGDHMETCYLLNELITEKLDKAA